MPRRRLCGSAHTTHAFPNFHGTDAEGLAIRSRRNMMKAGIAGLAGLSLPALLQHRAEAAKRGVSTKSNKAVILLWMTGGPSHIDMWDMKPDRPLINRGPFSPINTNVPGIQICEHLPEQAAMMDRFTLIRSVDCRKSSHQPNMVMQSGHRDATPRTNPKGDQYPSIASIVAKHHGPNHPSVPPYVAFQKHPTHVGYAGYLGQQYDPFDGNRAAKLPIYDLVGKDSGRISTAPMFRFANDLNFDRIDDRQQLLQDFDRIKRDVDANGSMEAMEAYRSQAVDMVLGKRVQQAFDLSLEPQKNRDRYGKHLWHQQALLARRLVESGVAFVTLDLSYHTASGTWDNHGDNTPPYGGITRGLGPILPLYDHLVSTLVRDLEERGMLDDVLVVSMGEFGRTPNMGTQGSTDGRNHWPTVMSMCLAGGGMRHGQVIGATEKDGAQIASRPVTPGDLAATIYHHMDVPLTTMYDDEKGRPRFAVQENGRPLSELV